ncbi:glycosyltransferase [Mesorhizobium sp. B292B1B]|uniref:glycosyltransferase n=1 Tax=unclassified Mesorhizobium TaxID=325217 RepID=UPI00112C6398|nr:MULTISPECIES: glycosyltransferase [unclassified Mesorhizobium]MCA0012911.1 glycosyltransferase [Mesorhizobium sp. B294B1A1]MCA0037588.1 glycosyltransferase [Mesorhizobium sp. B292B1B]TPM50695.1 glycosyltransferase family 4 protein [Mesorhizobium sp. B2-3-2]
MRKVLHLIPFPIANALHGGQIRARETNAVLRGAGLDVRTACIFDAGLYPNASPDIDLSGELPSAPWQLRDFVTAKAFAENDRKFGAFAELLNAAKPDLIVFEEPWLGKALLKAKAQGLFTCPILYNSYNVEFIAKGNILADAGISDREKWVDEIRDLEREIVSSAAVTACTAEDAKTLSPWAETEISIAPNGATKRKRSHLSGILHQGISPNSRYALFVGSGHPPNVAGFRDLVLRSLPALTSAHRVIVAGSVCDPLYSELESSGLPYMSRDKIGLLGTVTDFALDCLIKNASAILLPITYGGGSNLKTAEALLSGKPIVATRKAFRAYEDFSDADTVTLADTPKEFGSAIRHALSRESRKAKEDPRLERLLWSNTLKPIVEIASRLARV